MSRPLAAWLTVPGLLLVFAAAARPQVKAGQPAPDLPPLPFSDGRSYRLDDLKGKVVVLYFFEPQ